jgi:nitrite reductase/ring-hydroxylating ferredoxin subunit/uncharacterized membrane protein
MKQTALSAITDQPALDAVAEPLSRAVRGVFEAAGPGGAAVKNALHGVWLGHPLHPVLTDLPLGAWTTALALDACADRDPGMERAATFAMGLGLLGAAGSAITGLTDWSETGGASRRAGLVHGLLNVAATTLIGTAYVRRVSSSGSGRACAWAGYMLSVAAAYIGGDLVYGRRIGVTHAVTDEPESFVDVGGSDDVPEGTMCRVRHEDVDVLLARRDGRVCALAHTCAHLGGPLSEGTLKKDSVVCPWHGSEFSLDDGHVINGPATMPQPVFEVREQNGRIEIRGV